MDGGCGFVILKCLGLAVFLKVNNQHESQYPKLFWMISIVFFFYQGRQIQGSMQNKV